ncbi:MAG: hypothetical protein ACOCWA_05465 [Bacteroidota bacterium]
MLKKIYIIYIVLCLSLISLRAQEITIRSSLERDSALIGEQLRYSVQLISDSPLHSYIALDDNLFPSRLEVISEFSDSSVNERLHEYFISYLITSFDSGSYEINSIPVLVNDFSELDTLFTQSHELNFYMPEVDTAAAIKDIKEPISTPFRLSELLPYMPFFGGGLVLVAVLLLIYFMFFRKKKEADVAKSTLPPHLKALESLDRIKREKIWQKGEVKDYYSQLSDTIRIYIEERFEIPAMESVTWEILKDFRKYSWDDESLMQQLESLLQLSDLVKFAKEDPSPTENETHLNNAYIFIEKTKQESSEMIETEQKV